MNTPKRRDLWRSAQASVLRDTSPNGKSACPAVISTRFSFFSSVVWMAEALSAEATRARANGLHLVYCMQRLLCCASSPVYMVRINCHCSVPCLCPYLCSIHLAKLNLFFSAILAEKNQSSGMKCMLQKVRAQEHNTEQWHLLTSRARYVYLTPCRAFAARAPSKLAGRWSVIEGKAESSHWGLHNRSFSLLLLLCLRS